MSSLLDVVKDIKTPLALGGLALVVLYGLFRALIAKNSGANGAINLNRVALYVFILALVGVVLGVYGYISDATTLTTIAGIVVDSDDQPVGGAEVFVEGMENILKTTQTSGNFELQVPTRSTYVVRARYKNISNSIVLPWKDIVARSIKITLQKSPKSQSVDVIKNAILTALRDEQPETADNLADKLLAIAPGNFAGLNAKGTVAFYRCDYQKAVEHFSAALHDSALEDDATNRETVMENLGDAYIEAGAPQKALETYLKLTNDGRPTTRYRIGRAYVYLDEYKKATGSLESVPTALDRGKARILEAAAIAGRVEREPLSRAQLGPLRVTMRARLDQGMAQDRPYWESILTGAKRDIHEGFDKARTLLSGVLEKAVGWKPTKPTVGSCMGDGRG